MTLGHQDVWTAPGTSSWAAMGRSQIARVEKKMEKAKREGRKS